MFQASGVYFTIIVFPFTNTPIPQYKIFPSFPETPIPRFVLKEQVATKCLNRSEGIRREVAAVKHRSFPAHPFINTGGQFYSTTGAHPKTTGHSRLQ